MPAAAESGLPLNVPWCEIFCARLRRLAEIEQFQDVAAARKRTAGQPTGENLGQCRHVRADSIIRLGSAGRAAKTGNHLVEDQEHTAHLGQFGKRFDEFLGDRHLPPARAGGLDNHRGDIIVRMQRGERRLEVARRRQHDVGGDLRQYARRRRAVEMRAHAERHMIVPAVKVSGEAQDFWPAREGPRQSQSQQCGLGAGVRKADQFGRRHELLHELAPANLQLVAGAVMRATRQLSLGCLDDRWVIVPQEQRPVAARVIDVFIAIHVPLPRSGGPRDIHRIGFEKSAVVRHAAGKDRLCRWYSRADVGVRRR